LSDRGAFRALLVLAAAGLCLVLLLPLGALVATLGRLESWRGLGSGAALSGLWLSLWTTALSTSLIALCGTPVAWALAQRRSRMLETALALPAVVPPAVAGVALLVAFGRRGLLGALLPDDVGIAFTPLAVVLAQAFVAAPFYVQAAISAFRRIAPELLIVAKSLGAGPLSLLLRVALPLARPGLLAGAALAWARALGEFGATLMFAGNLEGRTQTLPLTIYVALESDLGTAQALSALLVLVALAVLLLARALVPDAEAPGRG
jgi:molybdate transport system permease protein